MGWRFPRVILNREPQPKPKFLGAEKLKIEIYFIFAYHNDDEKKKLSDEEILEDIEITNRLVYIPKVRETNEFDILDFLQNEEVVSYFIYQIEQCPTSGRLHYQGYVQFKKEKRITALKKINNRANWGETNGSAESNKNTVQKMTRELKDHGRKVNYRDQVIVKI